MTAANVIPPVERMITLTDMVAYAGATWDWDRLHYDAEYLAAAGMPKPVVDGQMLGALFARQLMDHFGPGAFITNLGLRYRSMVLAGDSVRCEAEVTAVEDGHATVAHRALVGDRVAADGTARVRL